MKAMVCLAVLAAVTIPALAADAQAGRMRAEAVCAACHGANGVSVSDTIPNLAGQKARYLEAQLRALKAGTRRSDVMNAIAAQLGADDIANLAAHYAAQAGAAAGSKSEILPNLAKTSVKFPDDYRATFTRYHTIDFPETRQVRHYFANDVALRAAREGRPLPDGSVLFAEVHSARLDGAGRPVTGTDGQFVADKLLFYTAMARDAGWGREIPDMLRNDDWNYAVFTTDGRHRAGVNQAECLACHKPRDKVSYLFTLDPLAAAARRR